MKRILFSLLALFSLVVIKANPIMLPSVHLSELYFEEQGKWIIELEYYDVRPGFLVIDTIWIKTSSGISSLKRFTMTGSTGLIIIRNDSLLTPLQINPVSDFIQISYTNNYPENNYREKVENRPVIYGNMAKSKLDSPKPGQSIAGIPLYYRFDSRYSLDKSPGIGSVNDSIGMCGTLKGYMYNRHNKLVAFEGAGFYGYPETDACFTSKKDGSYSTRLYSKKYHLENLYFFDSKAGVGTVLKITPVDILMKPDSVVTMDIHILDSLTVGTQDIMLGTENIIKLFPNPAKGFLQYEISLPVSSTRCYLELTNMNGQKLERFDISENKGSLSLPFSIRNGVYFINLYAGNKKYSSSKIMISR